MTQVLVELLETLSPAMAVRGYFGAAAHELEASGYLDGCPVTPIIMDIDEASADLAAVCRDVMTRWRDLYVQGFVAAGMAPDRARSLAILAIAALEGALIMSRAARNTDAITTTGHEVAAMVEQALSPV